MNNLDVNALGVSELNESEMMETNGEALEVTWQMLIEIVKDAFTVLA